MQHAVRPGETRKGVRLVVFGVDSQQDAKLRMQLQIGLELTVCLGKRRLLSDLKIFRPVIADNAAPERVVQIQIEGLLILAVDRLDDIGDIEGEIRDRRNGHGIFIHVPVVGSRPAVKTVGRGDVIHVADMEIFVDLRVFVKRAVQRGHKIDPAMIVAGVLIPQQTEERKLKVVLNDGTVIGVRQMIP